MMYSELKKGMVGGDVENLQMQLYTAAFYHNRGDFDPVLIDGKFGSKTETAVRNFQKALGLKVDGIVGENTWAALEGVNSSDPGSFSFITVGKPFTGSIPGSTYGGGTTGGKALPQIPQPTGSGATVTTGTASQGEWQGPAKPKQQVDWTIIGIAAAVLFGVIYLMDDSK